MNKDDIAYAAGLFDAEGCVLISKQKGTIRMIHPLHTLRVKLGCVNQSAMNWFGENFGGPISSVKPKKERRKIFFHWQKSSNRGADFLRKILPYLKIKKPQAELALQFQNEVKIKPKRECKEITPESLRLREKLKNQISLLNQRHSQKEFKSMNERKIAYAAGFLDGDGYIEIHIRRFRWNTGKNPIYCLVVGSGCLDQPIINWLKKNFGGSVYTEKSTESTDNFRWRIGADSAMNFLQEILPHLRLKVPQAKLAIQFQKMNRNNIKKRMRRKNEDRRVSPEFLQQRERLRQQILFLNRRG